VWGAWTRRELCVSGKVVDDLTRDRACGIPVAGSEGAGRDRRDADRRWLRRSAGPPRELVRVSWRRGARLRSEAAARPGRLPDVRRRPGDGGLPATGVPPPERSRCAVGARRRCRAASTLATRAVAVACRYERLGHLEPDRPAVAAACQWQVSHQPVLAVPRSSFRSARARPSRRRTLASPRRSSGRVCCPRRTRRVPDADRRGGDTGSGARSDRRAVASGGVRRAAARGRDQCDREGCGGRGECCDRTVHR
jgi:hypothetical protein